jgi:hypothetical protein
MPPRRQDDVHAAAPPRSDGRDQVRIFEASSEISIIPRYNIAARDPEAAAPAE